MPMPDLFGDAIQLPGIAGERSWSGRQRIGQ
jgi:hypothetical protein